MARRFHILSSIAFLLAFSVQTTVFAATYYANSVAGLNAIFNQAGQNAIVNDDIVVLTITEQDGVWREWRNTDAMNGLSGPNFTLAVTKNGEGNWRLGEGTQLTDPITGQPAVDPVTGQPLYMANILISGSGANVFNVGAGILDLMQRTTITMTGGAGSGFQVAGGANLNARGANTITTAGPLTLLNNSTLGFDLTHFTSGTPILTIAGVVPVLADPADRVNINLLGFSDIEVLSGTGPTAMLLQYNYTPVTQQGATEPDPPPIHVGTVNLQVRGEDWDDVVATGRLSGQLQLGPTADGATSLMITNLHSDIGTVTWTGATNNAWNATTSNWTGIGSTFLHGDSVIFGNGPTLQDILVQAGGVQIGGAQASGPAQGQVGTMLVNGGSYSFTNAGGSTIGIDGQGSVIVSGQLTTLDFNSANSYWGGTTIGSGVLTARNAGALGTGTVSISGSSGILTFDIPDNNPAGDSPTVWNSITGVAESKIVKENGGRLHLNSVSGSSDTIIREGTLYYGIGGGLLTVHDGAYYDAYNYIDRIYKSPTVAGLHDYERGETGWQSLVPRPSGEIRMGEGRLTTNVGVGKVYTFSGTISGSGGLTKIGAGTQILTGDSPNLTGVTNIDQGRIVIQRELDNDWNIRTLGTGNVSIAQDAYLQFDINGDDPVDQWIATFDNAIQGEGHVIKMAYPDTESPRDYPAILHLTSSVSEYTGRTEVHEGILRLSHVNATGRTSEVQLAAGTTLQFAREMTGTGTYDRIITGAGNVEVLQGLSGTTRTVIFLSGTNDDRRGVVSDYTGETIIQANAELHLVNAAATGKTSLVELVAGTSHLYLDFMNDETYDRYITGAGNLWKTGTVTVTLDFDPARKIPNDYTGTTRVENGILKLMYAEATGANDLVGTQKVTVNGDGILELAFNGEYNKGITGTGAIAKSGGGTVTTLKGYSNYTGGTYIWGGTLSFTDTTSTIGNLGSGGVYFQNGGGTLRNTALNQNFNQKIEIDGGSTAIFDTRAGMTIKGSGGMAHIGGDPTQKSHVTKTGQADLTIETNAAWTGSTIVEQGWLIGNIPVDTKLTVMAPGGYRTENADRQVSFLDGDGTVETFMGRNFTVNYSAEDDSDEDDFAGTITGGGNLVKTGSGLFILSGENNDYGGKTIVRTGTLRGNIATGTALTVEGTGTYESGGVDRFIRSLEGSGNVDMQARSLTINMFQGGEATFNGQIRNGRRFQKSGAGTQILGGLSYDFSDSVRITEGTLKIGANSSAMSTFRTDGDLDVWSNGTLATDRLAKVKVGGTLTIDGTFDVTVGNNPTNTVTATDVKLGTESTINITGITSTTETRTIIQSENEFDSRFKYVNAGGSADVDYLIFGVYYEPKAVKVGQTLRWYSGIGDEEPDPGKRAHGTFTIDDPDGEYDVGVSLADVSKNSSWNGKTLTKEGPGMLILSAENKYTGETLVNGGTLQLANAKATAGSQYVKLGNDALLELDFNGSMATPITGTGTGVYKIGDSVSVLTGNNTYSADTTVKQGSLYVDGALLASQVWVDAGAGFGGNGKVNDIVYFRDGSFFDWRFGQTEAQSDLLTAAGINIGNDVRVRPINTANWETLANIDGWKILRYGGSLNNRFAGVENGANPYYDFELDYSESGWVKINGFLRDEPRALSDVVATSLVMAQSQMYRSVYQQIAREWASDCPDHPVIGRNVNGQSPRPYRTAWMNFVGRGEQYASKYFDENYLLQSYGVQVGFSLLSNCRTSLGIMYGREESKLGNFSDTVRGEDNYLGLYFGRAFVTDIDFRGYIGGGWQNNRLDRNSNGYLYHANYGGNTFNIDAEIGRRFLTERLWTLRPFIGLDLAHAGIGRSTETCSSNPNSNEYRSYDRATFTQFLSRIGIEVGKGWRRFDINSGIHLAWNWADTDPTVKIYYPMTGGPVLSRASDIGRFDLVMNIGVNWYITPQRNTMFYLNYVGDINLDRHGTGGNTGYVGFQWRF